MVLIQRKIRTMETVLTNEHVLIMQKDPETEVSDKLVRVSVNRTFSQGILTLERLTALST